MRLWWPSCQGDFSGCVNSVAKAKKKNPWKSLVLGWLWNGISLG